MGDDERQGRGMIGLLIVVGTCLIMSVITYLLLTFVSAHLWR